MRKIDRLRKEANDACKWRGHNMKWDKIWDEASRKRQMGECKNCSKWVLINARPMPNDIDIGGPAVALACGD